MWWIHGLAAVIAISLCAVCYMEGYMEGYMKATKNNRNDVPK
jgi:hypothetical protein